MICWECEVNTDNIHHHHVVPRSRGGQKTVPLCLDCHAKAHHRKKAMSSSRLVKEALAAKKARSAIEGTWAGGRPPKGFTVDPEGYLVPNKDFPLVLKAVSFRLQGVSLRKTAQIMGVSNHSAIQRWTNPWMDKPEQFFAYANFPDE